MERLKVEVHTRETRGKGAARKLRSRGQIPAVFYGPRIEPVPVVFDSRELLRLLQHGQNVLIDLKIRDDKGNGKESNHVAMIKDIQVDPLKGVPIHVDLYGVSMKETMTVEVPVRLVGKPEGTKMGGILEQVRRELEVECLPADLPPYVEVDVTPLNIGDSIHVQDIKVDKVKILTDPHLTVATVVAPVVEREAAAEAAISEAEEEAEELG
ncbi:MAG: 50S ribosomal protein L25, partial [Deltaproteobacteria bacterium]|nr:50S ribosomal protein L25 [Deltaproteobacteria bacterium]